MVLKGGRTTVVKQKKIIQMKKQKANPELKVVFDTNAIYSGTANFLLNEQVSEFIKKNSKFYDLDVTYYIPELVIKERTFQMISKGNELLQPIKKLEKLLGHNLNITEEVIVTRVRETIEKQINEYNLQIVKVDTKNIDWERLIHNSVFRLPPFENNSKEKGFRDSIIVETFNQLIENSPKTPKSCRIVLVSGDNLLNEAAKLKAEKSSNIRFVEDLNGLKSLINILVSEIEEAVVERISQYASEIFFIPKEESTLFYTEDIRNQIIDKYRDKLFEIPDSKATRTSFGTWYISPVNFVKKEKQKIFWRSEINVDLISYKKESKSELTTIGIVNPLNYSFNYPISGSTKTAQNIYIGSPKKEQNIYLGKFGLGNKILESEYGKSFEEIEYLKGQSNFEIIWSVTYRTNEKLSNPKIEEINFVENIWNNKE